MIYNRLKIRLTWRITRTFNKIRRFIRIGVRDIHMGLYNFWNFRKVIWNYRPWDYEYMLEVWIKTLECQEIGMINGVLANSDRYVKQIHIAKLLLQRVKDRNYNDKYSDKIFEQLKPTTMVINQDTQDLEMFGQILSKSLRKWWT